jgi:uncharacterized membrane protein YjgN (DUF898 family)
MIRHLPVTAAFRHAVLSTWNNLGFAFHASLPWLVVLIPLNVWASLSMTAEPLLPGQQPTPEQMRDALLFYATSALSSVIYASIAVGWHRYILQDEVPLGRQRLRLDATVWRYVGNSFLVILMVTLLIMPRPWLPLWPLR